MFGDIIQGGWNAIDNVVSAAGGALKSFTSPFFPAPQKTTIQSQITAPVENTGLTYRPTSTDAPSMFESWAYAAQGWLGSPQEPLLSIPAKRQESSDFASQISSTTQTKSWSDNLVDILSGTVTVLGEAAKIKTVVDEIVWDLGIKDRPIEGTNETAVDMGQPAGADVVGILQGFGSYFLDQVKGLFNLGYSSPTGAQPAFAIKHELQPSKATTIGIVAIVGVLILVFIFGRKK